MKTCTVTLKRAFLFSLFVCFVIALTGCLTTTVSTQDIESLQRIVELPGYSKADIYNKSLDWFARTYNSANNVIQLRDPDAGKIIGRGMGYVDFGLGTGDYYSYTMIVDIQEGRMRVRYENFDISKMNSGYWWKKIMENTEKHTDSLIDSIHKKQVEDNW